MTKIYEGTCMICHHKLPIGLLYPLNGKFLCKSCWSTETQKVLKQLVFESLKKRGYWNPSER